MYDPKELFADRESIDSFVEDTLSDYGEYVNGGMARLYRFLGFTTLEWYAEGSTLVDIHGKRYIDCAGYGLFFHGHRNPRVVEAVKKQLDTLPLSSRTLPHKPVADLGKLLAQVTPGNLQYSFFANSGAEANEGALKLARAYTKRERFVATHGAFHGKTFGGLSASGRELYKKPFYPLLPHFDHVPFGDIEAMRNAVTEETAAVILEPIQGEGGVLLPPEGYLQAVREICDEKGALLIFDEVQTGIGRTGKMFAAEHYNVVPDIITMAKSLGGGVMPIGAFTAKPEIWSIFDENPYIHSSTFGGNPLSCAAGVAAIEVILEENLLERATLVGERLLKEFTNLKERYPEVIKDVRGKGLLIGLELATEGAGGMMISETIDRNLLVLHSLNNPKVIRVMPPAVITDTEVDRVIEVMKEATVNVAEVISQL